MLENYGYCGCGCEHLPPVAKVTRKRWGHRQGEPVRFVRGHNARKYAERFEKQDRGYGSPCLIWLGAKTNGYARVSHGGRLVNLHRHLYEQAKGPLGPEVHVDHLCNQRDCCELTHLEPVSQAENVRRGFVHRWGGTAQGMRSWRLQAGLTQTKMAQMLGVAQTTISNWEREKTQPPSDWQEQLT